MVKLSTHLWMQYCHQAFYKPIEGRKGSVMLLAEVTTKLPMLQPTESQRPMSSPLSPLQGKLFSVSLNEAESAPPIVPTYLCAVDSCSTLLYRGELGELP